MASVSTSSARLPTSIHRILDAPDPAGLFGRNPLGEGAGRGANAIGWCRGRSTACRSVAPRLWSRTINPTAEPPSQPGPGSGRLPRQTAALPGACCADLSGVRRALRLLWTEGPRLRCSMRRCWPLMFPQSRRLHSERRHQSARRSRLPLPYSRRHGAARANLPRRNQTWRSSRRVHPVRGRRAEARPAVVSTLGLMVRRCR